MLAQALSSSFFLLLVQGKPCPFCPKDLVFTEKEEDKGRVDIARSNSTVLHDILLQAGFYFRVHMSTQEFRCTKEGFQEGIKTCLSTRLIQRYYYKVFRL